MEIDDKTHAAIAMIQTQLKELEDIDVRVREDVDYAKEWLKRWRSRTVKLLSDRVNPEEGRKLHEIIRNFASDDAMDTMYDANRYRTFLLSLKEELEKHPEGIFTSETQISPATVKAKQKISTSRTVFIVHGRDEATKQSVARLLEKLELKVVILHERPNEGKTLFEKFEANSAAVDIDYAVVILTPDDVGSLASEKDKPQPRARQNVVFELGYFMAKLGRQKVCVLYTVGIELPSDYQGVYTPLDKGGAWMLSLAREIKASGINIDLNNIT